MKSLLQLSIIFLSFIHLQAQGWGQTQKIVAADRALGNEFAYAVALQGSYCFMGSRRDDTTSSNSGSVYVFKDDGTGVWIQEQFLTQSSTRQFDQFGNSLAVDGNYLIVGCSSQDYDENEANYINDAPGAAYVFEKDSNGNWIQTQKLVASDRARLDVFGDSVAISGEYAVVTAPWEDEDENDANTLDLAGSAFVFERDTNGVWQRVQKIVASDRKAGMAFGESALAIDGDHIAVGVFRETEDGSGNNILGSAGAVYIFKRNAAGNWNEEQKIVASDREIGEWFGASVALQGNTLVVGASQEYLLGNTSAQYGAVYVFEKDGSGVWNEVQKIRPDFLNRSSKFGHSVDLDGNRMVVGAYLMDVDTSVGGGGAGFVFEKDATGTWNQVANIYDSEATTSDYFGFAVAISGDLAIVGAYQEDHDENGINYIQSSGSLYVFNANEPNNLPPLNTLSVFENEFGYEIKAYPNPVEDVLNIDLSSNYSKVSVKIRNTMGQEVYSKSYINTNTIELMINYPNGIYLVELKNSEGAIAILKVVKQ